MKPPPAAAPARPLRHVVPLVAAGVAVLLAGCGGTTGAPGRDARPDLPALVTPPAITAIAAPSSPGAAPGSPPPCTAGQLTPSVTGTTDTLGQWNFSIRVTNTSEVDCSLQGFPSVVAVSGAGHPPARAAEMAGAGTPPVIELRPALGAAADLHLDDGDPGDTTCRRTHLGAVTVQVGSATVGQVSLGSGHWLCDPEVPGQLGIGSWAAAGHPDTDENDA